MKYSLPSSEDNFFTKKQWEKSENVSDIKEEFDDAQNFHIFNESWKIFGSIKIFLGMTEFGKITKS